MSNNVLQKIIDKKKLKLEKIKNEIWCNKIVCFWFCDLRKDNQQDK